MIMNAEDIDEVALLRKRVAELEETLIRIRIASEFHAQDAVAGYVARYAHNSNVRLINAVLPPRETGEE